MDVNNKRFKTEHLYLKYKAIRITDYVKIIVYIYTNIYIIIMYMLTRTYIYCHKKSIFSLIALLVLQSYNVTISIDDFQQNMYNIYVI